ncbi:MAG: hypothetical protein HQL69_17460 [Magnetococcales bacterium]|nr:hypothetical protein [Magnetococcales bacterium]
MKILLLLSPFLLTWALYGLNLVTGAYALATGLVLFFFLQIPVSHWFKFLLLPLFKPLPNPANLAEKLHDLSCVARKDGMLALDKENVDFGPLALAKDHCVDGADPDFLAQAMTREKERVLRAIKGVRDNLTYALFGVGLLIIIPTIMQATREGMDAAQWYFMTLLGIVVLGVVLNGHLNQLSKNLETLYVLITDGMLGVMTGTNPRMLQELLNAGFDFQWPMARGREPVRWGLTQEEIDKSLEKYLEEKHPRVKQVDVAKVFKKSDGKPEPITFGSLAHLDDHAFQRILKEADELTIQSALGRAHPEVLKKTINNITPRLAHDLLSHFEYPSWLEPETRVSRAQESILEIFFALQSQGILHIHSIPLEKNEESKELAFTQTDIDCALVDHFDTYNPSKPIDASYPHDWEEKGLEEYRFSDMTSLSDEDMQTLLYEIPNAELLTSLKRASQGIVRHFIDNISIEVAALILDDMTLMGEIEDQRIHDAQYAILEIMFRLKKEGDISLGDSITTGEKQ